MPLWGWILKRIAIKLFFELNVYLQMDINTGLVLYQIGKKVCMRNCQAFTQIFNFNTISRNWVRFLVPYLGAVQLPN
jgi:hypothetical protein